jgi:hypothetical protein
MKTLYLLPCKCGRRWEVDAGQAGTQIACSCGQSLEIPSIRGLRQLEIVSASAPDSAPRAVWSPWRGAIFSLGLAATVAAFIFSAVNMYWFWKYRRLSDPAEFALRMANDEVDRMNPEEVVGTFRNDEAVGLGVPYPPPWVEFDKYHDESGQRALLGLVVAGAGLVAAAVSMVGRPKNK